MVYRNKRLCVRCNKYLPCKITDNICCECKGLPYNFCPVCKWEVEYGGGRRTLMDQRTISQYNYETYKRRLSNPQFSCSKCGKELGEAGHHGQTKQRYQTKFWELKTPYKTLCFDCLNKYKTKMPTSKKYTFNKYVKRYTSY